MDDGIEWSAVAGGASFALVGILAYVGNPRHVWMSLWPSAQVGFGMLWFGFAGLLIGFGWPLLGEEPASILIGVPTVLCWMVGMLSFRGLPRGLQPGWYRSLPPRVRRHPRP